MKYESINNLKLIKEKAGRSGSSFVFHGQSWESGRESLRFLGRLWTDFAQFFEDL